MRVKNNQFVYCSKTTINQNLQIESDLTRLSLATGSSNTMAKVKNVDDINISEHELVIKRNYI